jgi:hypothetical protein
MNERDTQEAPQEYRLTNVERTEQARRLLTDYLEAVSTAPELTQALRDAYFNPDKMSRNFEHGAVYFQKGEFRWLLNYHKRPYGGETLYLEREIQSESNKATILKESVGLNIFPNPNTQLSHLKFSEIAYTRRPGPQFADQTKPSFITNTTQAVRKAEGFLEEFRMALSAPKSQA